jgi:cob(I)alamin adenosyltransferase
MEDCFSGEDAAATLLHRSRKIIERTIHFLWVEGSDASTQYRHSRNVSKKKPCAEKNNRMKIYTKTGDAGETGLFGGPRVAKDHARIEAFGTVDELNSHLGLIRTVPKANQFDALLRSIQCELFDLGAQLATPGDSEERITVQHVEILEQHIDMFDEEIEPLKCFILPTGTPLAAEFHVARTVCRRAERRVVSLAGRLETMIPANAIEYLNRLGDLLFVLARLANLREGVEDDPWHPS